MKITLKNDIKLMEFNDIGSGQCFRWYNTVFMKIQRLQIPFQITNTLLFNDEIVKSITEIYSIHKILLPEGDSLVINAISIEGSVHKPFHFNPDMLVQPLTSELIIGEF